MLQRLDEQDVALEVISMFYGINDLSYYSRFQNKMNWVS